MRLALSGVVDAASGSRVQIHVVVLDQQWRESISVQSRGREMF